MAGLSAEEFKKLASVEITFKTGDKVTYRCTEAEQASIATTFEQAVRNNARTGIFDVHTEDGSPRKLSLDFREVRFIG